MKKLVAGFLILLSCGGAYAEMRRITCAAASTAVSPAKASRRNFYVKNVHGSGVNVTICFATTCTTGIGIPLTQYQDFENRGFYSGPISCIGTDTLIAVSED